MNPMQRTLAALGHAEPDQAPLFLFATLHGARELGLPLQDYFASAANVVAGQLALLEKYRSDCLCPFFYAALETEAWGGEVRFRPDGPANAGAPFLTAAGIDSLRAPGVREAPGLQRGLRAIAGLKARVGATVPIIGIVMSPFSLPVMQMGFDRYLELMHEEPGRFERLMRVNEDFAVDWANAQLAAGATAICYFDPVASGTVIPRERYLRAGQPVARRTLARIQGPTATHLASGRGLEILLDLADTGTAAVGVSSLEDLGQLKRRAAGRVALVGNLNGIEMRRWTPAQAELEVKRILARAGRGGGLVVSDNHGEIPWQVPEAVLLAIREAVDRWGRYPLDWVDRWDAGEGA